MSTQAKTSEDYWHGIGGQILSELERRLGDGADAKDLPGTLLMRLAEKYLQFLDKQAQELEDEKHYMTALEAIDQEGLPIDAKVGILKDYISTLEADHETAMTRLEELMKEQNDRTQVHEPVAPGDGDEVA